MANKSVKMDDLASAVNETLTLYAADITKETQKLAETTAKDTKNKLKKAGQFEDRSGNYRKGWTTKTVVKNANDIQIVVYNKVYQLTHLLEYGHVKRGGGRVRAYPHIAPVEEQAVREFTQQIERIIRNT